MTKGNLIHIKFGYGEALRAKRDILSLQIVLLRIARVIKGFGTYRSGELELKLVLYQKMKMLKTNLRNLQKILPTLELPKILKKEGLGETEHKFKKTKSPERNIEEQLLEIQKRLNELQSRA